MRVKLTAASSSLLASLNPWSGNPGLRFAQTGLAAAAAEVAAGAGRLPSETMTWHWRIVSFGTLLDAIEVCAH